MYDDFGTLAVFYSALSLFASSKDAMQDGRMRRTRKRWTGSRGQSLAVDMAIAIWSLLVLLDKLCYAE